MDYITKIRDEFANLRTEGLAVTETAAKENRELTADERTANDTRFARMEQIEKTIADHLKFADKALQDGKVTLPKLPPGKEEFDAGGVIVGDKFDKSAFASAINHWAFSGNMDRKFATITTATSSGALLPKTVTDVVVPTSANVFREALALYGLKPVQTNTTAALTVPVFTASAGGAVAENASSETENAPSATGSIVLNCATYQSGSAWFSNQVLSANDFDLVTYANDSMVYAKEMGFESAIIAAMIADAGITQVKTCVDDVSFTYGELVDLNRLLPKRYDRSKVILLSATAFAAAEKLVGDDGHPVLVKDPQNAQLLRFNGTPVLRSDYLEALVANKTIGLVVSMLGFKIRDAGDLNLARYTQSPAKPNQTGFNLFGYHAHGYDVAAVGKLKTAVS